MTDAMDMGADWPADDLPPPNPAHARETTGDMVVHLAVVWLGVATGAYFLGEGLAARFLDLPLGAYLAGQGVFIAIVLVSVRIVALRNGGYRMSRSAATSGASAGGIG